MTHKTVLNAALVVAMALPAMAQNDAKGIYVEGSRPAMKFNILLERGDKSQVVSPSFPFRSGDRMKFQFDLNKDLYVYVLHRTVEGDERDMDRYSGARGITVIHDDDRKKNRRDSYDLLFPGKASGNANLIRAHNLASIPRGDGSFFKMDNQPGMEKLIVVASPTKIRIEDFFDVETGHVRDDGRGASNDRDEDVLDRLNRSLLDYSGNSLVEESSSKDSSSKGITVEGSDDHNGYAAARDSGKAIVVTVDLKHLPRR
jgi:hypothetical protein